MLKKLFVPSFIGLLFVLISCGDTQYQKDIRIIEEYIASNSLDTNKIIIDEFGVYYIELKEGYGSSVEKPDSIVFAYSLRLENGIEASFATSGEPYGAPVASLVSGLQLGLTNMKTSGEAIILMPSSLGYGPYWLGTIPANSVLIFYVELLKIVR